MRMRKSPESIFNFLSSTSTASSLCLQCNECAHRLPLLFSHLLNAGSKNACMFVCDICALVKSLHIHYVERESSDVRCLLPSKPNSRCLCVCVMLRCALCNAATCGVVLVKLHALARTRAVNVRRRRGTGYAAHSQVLR